VAHLAGAPTVVYGNTFALNIAEPTVDAQRGVRSAVCTPPSGGVIEFVSVHNRNQPLAESVAEFLQSRGEGMYALVPQSRDLRRSAKNLAARGVEVHNVAGVPDLVEIERASTFVARIWLESA
jgi:hypothetical protein